MLVLHPYCTGSVYTAPRHTAPGSLDNRANNGFGIRGSQPLITANQLRTKWNGRDRWISDGGARNTGRLVARLRREGVTFDYQYFGPEGAKRLLLIGSYDLEGVRGLSLPEARDRAAELTALYRSGVLDLHGHFERQRADQEVCGSLRRRRNSGHRARRNAPLWATCSTRTPPTWNSWESRLREM
jgi:hypothetical protein